MEYLGMEWSEYQLPMAGWFVCILILAYIANRSIQTVRYREFHKLPMVGDPAITDLRSAMEEGTRKYPNSPWILPLRDPTVILPLSVVDEVKSLPESQVSIAANNYRRFFGRYTLMGTPADEFVAAIKQDLTHSVGDLIDEMREEVTFAAEQNIGTLKPGKWKSISVYPTMLRFIALLSGRVFVGLPLSRKEEWIQSSINYAIESIAAGHQLREYPIIARSIVAPFLAKIVRVQSHQARVREMLDPILSEKLQAETPKRQKKGGVSSFVGSRGRLAQWLLSHYTEEKSYRASSKLLGKDHLLASFAAIHIATNALTHILLDLAARQSYIAALREELKTVLAASNNGKLDTAVLAKLVKMDSFMKESLRVNPPGGIVTMMRQTMAPLKLPNGLTIPTGTLIAFPNSRFDMSNSTPQAPNPDEFDGFRYARLRATPGQETKHQLIGPSANSLTWGYGSHVCPGRAFAAAELKLILIHLLEHFEMKLRDGDKRPENSSQDFQIMPHPEATIILTPRVK